MTVRRRQLYSKRYVLGFLFEKRTVSMPAPNGEETVYAISKSVNPFFV